MSSDRGAILAVCVSAREVDLGNVGSSAIDKRPQDGRVAVDADGLLPDHVADTKHHGGADQAVYAYADDEARRWAQELGRDLPYGWFGENLRIAGLSVTDAEVGERWAIGADGLVVETTIPRIPCRTFAAWAQEPDWVKRFLARGDSGAYLRVIADGSVAAGDEVRVIHRPGHGVRVRDLAPPAGGDQAVDTPSIDALNVLLNTRDIAPKVRREANKVRARQGESA